MPNVKSPYGGLFSIITTREVNRLYEILDLCGREMGASVYPHGHMKLSNPIWRMQADYDNDFTQLPLKDFVSWLKRAEDHLREWFVDTQKRDAEELRWTTTWEDSAYKTQLQEELEVDLREASRCSIDLQTIRRNVEQRYRQHYR